MSAVGSIQPTTDEREWTIDRFHGEMICRSGVGALLGPTEVVPKARLESAEQERDNLRTAFQHALSELEAAHERIGELERKASPKQPEKNNVAPHLRQAQEEVRARGMCGAIFDADDSEWMCLQDPHEGPHGRTGAP